MTTTLARHALAADLPALELALAEAFCDDPMIVWVTGDDDRAHRRASIAAGFSRPPLEAGLVRGHTYTVDRADGSGLAGGAVWSAPDVRIFRDDEGGEFVTAMVEHVGAAAMERLGAIGELVGAHHPSAEPHFYLFVLGAAEQGHGVGGRLLQPVLDRCDAQALPAYLESSNARNLSFYRRHGFEVLWEDRPAPDGPLFHGMWRAPQG